MLALTVATVLVTGAFATCSRRGVVVFTGDVRGDVHTWESAKRHLVDTNQFDVIIDTWSTSPETQQLLEATLQPCDVFYQPYTTEWKQQVLAVEPRFQLIGDTLYAISPSETKHVVDQFYRLWHSASLLAKYNHEVVVRVRLDAYFTANVTIPEKLPLNSVFASLEWGYRYDEGEADPVCPKMMNDFFAYGDYWGMRTYNDVFPVMFRVLHAMQQDPGFRHWWDVGNIRAPGTFLANAESFLAWRLRLSNVSCHHVDNPFCLHRQHGSEWIC